MEIIIITHFYNIHINQIWQQCVNKNYIIPTIHNIAENDLNALKKIINTVDAEDNSLMHQGALHGFFEKVAVLIYLRADINPINNDLKTPLMLSAESGFKNIVELLLANGTDASEFGVYDRQYLKKWAVEHQHQDILDRYFDKSNLLGLTIADI